MRSKTVTQSHIAREAGVSQAAVSAILSGAIQSGAGTLNVSDETRVAVLAIAEKLGYVSRQSVSARQRGKKRNVMLVESEPYQGPVSEGWVAEGYESFFGKIIGASSRYLQKHGIGLSVFHLGESQKLTQRLSESDVDGVIWRAGESDSSLLYWVASRYPLVLLNREWRASIPFDTVGVDQEENIRVAAEYLWSQGHRQIATFGHYTGNSALRRRMSAYRRFSEEKGLRNYTEFQKIPDLWEISPRDKALAILEVWKRLKKSAPTALITGDVFALPLLLEARKARIAVPGDLSIVGIDNTPPCSLIDPPLTSVEQPFEELCSVAADLLLRRIADPKVPSQMVQIAPRLIERHSVKKINGTKVNNTNTSQP